VSITSKIEKIVWMIKRAMDKILIIFEYSSYSSVDEIGVYIIRPKKA